VRDDPKNVRWHNDCAGSWLRLGEAFRNLGRTAEAVEAYQKSRVHERQVHAQELDEGQENGAVAGKRDAASFSSLQGRKENSTSRQGARDRTTRELAVSDGGGPP
jgi:hypothetical protein